VIDAQSYSSGWYSQCSSHTGLVKLNGRKVWSGGSCSDDRDTGVHLFKIDPFDCTLKEHRSYNSYEKKKEKKKEKGRRGKRKDKMKNMKEFLNNYVRKGQVVIGVTANYEPAGFSGKDLGKLREKYGLKIGDVRRRGSFAFVAQRVKRQKGRDYPTKTVLVKVRSEKESIENPARLKVSITGMQELSVIIRGWDVALHV